MKRLFSCGLGFLASRLTVLTVTVALLAGCGKKMETAAPSAPGAKPLVKVRLQTDWYAQPEHGGFYQALAKGYYQEAGLDVEIIQSGPSVLVEQRVGLGQVEFGMLPSDKAILTNVRGLSVVMIGTYMQKDPQAILVHEESGITKFEDLDGKSVMALPGSCWIEYLEKRYHISFKIIPTNFGIAQFIADKKFIQQCFITNEPYYVRKEGAHPRVLMIADSGWSPYRGIICNPDFLKKKPEVARAFVAASTRGWEDYITGDPAPAFTRIHALNPQAMTPEFMAYARQSLIDNQIVSGDPAKGQRIGKLDLAKIASEMKTMLDLKIIDRPIPIEQIATTEFLPPALR